MISWQKIAHRIHFIIWNFGIKSFITAHPNFETSKYYCCSILFCCSGLASKFHAIGRDFAVKLCFRSLQPQKQGKNNFQNILEIGNEKTQCVQNTIDCVLKKTISANIEDDESHCIHDIQSLAKVV